MTPLPLNISFGRLKLGKTSWFTLIDSHVAVQVNNSAKDACYFLTHDNDFIIQLSCILADYHEMIFSSVLKCRQPKYDEELAFGAVIFCESTNLAERKDEKTHGFYPTTYRIAPIVPIGCRWQAQGANN